MVCWYLTRLLGQIRLGEDLRIRHGDAVDYSRDRQQPTRLCGILCKPPNFPGRKVRPHRSRLTHGKRSSVCHLESLGR
jgi:hypothetical protein